MNELQDFERSVADLMAIVAGETARAERFLQVLFRLFNDERVPHEIRVEYLKRTTLANTSPQ